jgi:transcriptional regulator with XRE-family HTH domain
MNTAKTNEMLIRQRIAANMAHYRKLNNMTQSELAERISYSDKSVSKWERAEGVPDIYVLSALAELFGVSVNDIISENAPLPPPSDSHVTKNRLIVLSLSVVLAWLIATVAYTGLSIFIPSLAEAWYAFIIAIFASCVVAVVFTTMWWGLIARFIAVSALVWSIAVNMNIIVPLENVDLVYAIGAVMQVLVILWFLFLRQRRKNRRETL